MVSCTRQQWCGGGGGGGGEGGVCMQVGVRIQQQPQE